MPYHMKITAPDAKTVDIDKRKPQWRIQYSIPGLGFGCEAYVNEQMARLLEIAMKAGREQAKAEIRDVLGIHHHV